MIISYHGVECFKISQGDLSLVVNPQAKMSADVTLFTKGRSPAFAEAPADKAGFVITGPGEYEIKDIFVKGFMHGSVGAVTTTYLITFENIKLCILGASEIPEDIEEDVDILFVPVNADPAAAYKLAVSIEPAVIIPMGHPSTGSGQVSKELAQFIKEGGEKVEPIEKFVVKKKDLEGKEGEIIILKQE